MFDPPPGFVDLLGDAVNAPRLGEPTVLDVEGVGVVFARRPRPSSLGLFAMAENPDLKPAERHEHLVGFLTDHLGSGEYARLTAQMIDDQLPADTFQRVRRAIVVQGTARPYMAVLILAVTTAAHWREIRRRIHASGIVDPMLLSSMHAILDFTETAIVESMRGDDAEVRRARFYDRLYAPDRLEVGSGRGKPPPGFSATEVESAFDSFASSMGAIA